jgi:hypothetical protein
MHRIVPSFLSGAIAGGVFRPGVEMGSPLLVEASFWGVPGTSTCGIPGTAFASVAKRGLADGRPSTPTTES